MNYYDQEVDKNKFPPLSSFLNFKMKLLGPILNDEYSIHRITEFVTLRHKMYCLEDEKNVVKMQQREFFVMWQSMVRKCV